MIKRSKGVNYDLSKPQKRYLLSGKRCPICGLIKSKWKRRTDWRCCSKECTAELWAKTTYWRDLRKDVFKRDKWACIVCGIIDTDKNGRMFVADHIIPISIGGPEWDIDNIQTLCSYCNKVKTKADMALIAEKRREEKNG